MSGLARSCHCHAEVVGVPKTIDNDIPMLDCTFGASVGTRKHFAHFFIFFSVWGVATAGASVAKPKPQVSTRRVWKRRGPSRLDMLRPTAIPIASASSS